MPEAVLRLNRPPDRLVDIYQNGTNPRGIDANTYPAYLDMAAYTDVFESTTAALVPHARSYRHDGALLSAIVENTTASYPSVLGLQPSLGRWFTTAEDTPGAAIVAIVNHQTWIRRFRSDPSIVGHTITIDGPDAAHGAAYFFVVTERGPDHWGRYRDLYVRRDGRWLFASRKVRVDGVAPGSWAEERRRG